MPKEYTQTICWNCANANALGCDWHKYFKPVKGWTAIRKDIKAQSGKGDVKAVESYCVVACPLFSQCNRKKVVNA